MVNEIDEELTKFNKWFEQHYQDEVKEIKKYCYFSTYDWNIDAFHDVYVQIVNSIQKGLKLKWNKPNGVHDYYFISYQNRIKSLNALKEKQLKDENHANFENIELPDKTDDDLTEIEEDFAKKYKFLVQLEYEINKKMGKKVGKVFTKKFNGEVLNIKKGERKIFEQAKNYIKKNYRQYYEENIK